jgi:hypothetical protein
MMEPSAFNIAILAAGLLLLPGGTWVALKAGKPADFIGALAAVAGIVAVMLGTIFIFMPGFFR